MIRMKNNGGGNGQYALNTEVDIDKFKSDCESLGISVTHTVLDPAGLCHYYDGYWDKYNIVLLVIDKREDFVSHVNFYDIPVTLANREWDWNQQMMYNQSEFQWRMHDMDIDYGNITDENERIRLMLKDIIMYFDKKISMNRQMDINDVDV